MSQQNARAAAVEERQLKPIYEALDTGNAKSALTHCNKLLKKYPPPPAPGVVTTGPPHPSTTARQIVTALKILSLVRGAKLDEASVLCTTLLAETPTDETVLSTLSHSLKPLDRPKDLVNMWVSAWTRAAKDAEDLKKKAKTAKASDADVAAKMQLVEELGAQSFMAMVKTGHWVMAQSTAFKLYRAFAPPKGQEVDAGYPALRYLYWSVMSAIMQSEYPNPPPPVPVLVMIPPPESVREYEANRKKEEEEDRKLLAEEGAATNGDVPRPVGSKLTPTRRKKRTLALTLAQRFIETSVQMKDGNLVGDEAVIRGMSVERFWLWADVLRRIAQAGDEDNGPSPDNRWLVPNNLMCTQLATAAAASSAHVEELRADIARKANDWKRECEGMALRLSKGDRNWKTFITFFDALFFFLPNAGETPNPDEYPCLPQEPVEVKKEEKAEQNGDAQLAEEPKEPAAPAAKVPFTVEETRKFVQKIAESDDEKFPKGERAGHLGVLELEKRLRKSAFASGDSPKFVDLIISYSKLFASKPVLPEDILPYLLELEDGEERSKWDAHVESIALETGDNDSLQQTINILKIQRLLSTSQSVTIESEQEFAKTCLKHYIAGLPLGKDLVSTDLQPVDDLALMAATALINVHHLSTQANCTEDSDEPSVAQQKYAKHLLDALVALEYAAGKSRWAYSMRLLLVRLHRLLGSSGLAMQNFTMANLKSIQFDTLSHHILDRASTFSLASVGDLTLVNECVESSQIYGIHGNEVSEQLVKAFQYERYSQIAEFVLLEEKVDNSLQRDLTKLEHFRMKNIHEGLTPESVEVELVELRFVWGRVHHDNRDFETLSNMLPRGSPSLDELTSVGGKKLSESWFRTMLQLWILVLHQTSEQLWTEEEQVTVRPKLLTFSDEALQELTPAERLLVKYGRALIAWLEPHHTPIKHSVMTSAVSTLATAKEKYAASTANGTANPSASAASSANTPSSGKSKSGANRKPNGLSNGTEGTAASSGEGGLGVKVGDMKVFTGMLTLHEPMEVPPMPKDMGEAVKEPPQDISTILDELQSLFDETIAKPSALPWEHLHVAQIAHEVIFLTHLLTARFALAGGKKKTHPTFKPLRAKSISLLDHVAKAITKLGQDVNFSAETRQSWIQDRRASGVLHELTDSDIAQVGRKYVESKKSMLEQLGKGLTKAQQSIAKTAAGVPAGSTQ